MESTAPTMAPKSSCGLSWATSLNSSLVTLFYTSCPWSWDAKHTSTARLLNLKFPLPGLPFPQIISWLTPSLPFQRGLLSLHYIKQQTGMQAHTQRCMHSSSLSLPFTDSSLFWFIFSHSICHHIIVFIALPNWSISLLRARCLSLIHCLPALRNRVGLYNRSSNIRANK